MKKIFCPKCDEAIVLSAQKLKELKESDGERMAIVCPSCTHQLRIRLKGSAQSDNEDERDSQSENWGHIVVLENVFGYKQILSP